MLEAEAQLTNARLNQQKGRVDAQSKLNQADATRRNAELSRQSTDAANAAKQAKVKDVAELANALATLRGAEAQVVTAKHNLEKTRLRAPADGVVVSVSKHVGELSQGGGGGGGGKGGTGGAGGDDTGFITMITFEDA